MRPLAAWQRGWSRVTSGGVERGPRQKGVTNKAAKAVVNGVVSALLESRITCLFICIFQHHLCDLRSTGILGKWEKPQAKPRVLSRLPLQMLSMKFSSHLAALARLFFTLGAFRLWQLTDLWHININYAVQPRGEGGRKGCAGCWRCGCCGCLYLLAATNDDDATKSALNTHYVRGLSVRAPPFATPPALLAVCTIALPSPHTLRPWTLSGVASLLSN